MQFHKDQLLVAVLTSLALHAALLMLAGQGLTRQAQRPEMVKPPEDVIVVAVPPPPVRKEPAPLVPVPATASALAMPQDAARAQAVAQKAPASQAAPPPPSAEEWAFAARYTNKNSKGYRYSWGQQVRSMMGTAIEGPDQGLVRFRVEIAPDGRLASLETLWSTSRAAEQLARQAIGNMPPLPPTPTGRPLVFEKTISFTPFASDGPPTYRDDCLPDPPAFRNPFAWDGKSPQVRAEVPVAEKLDPQAMEECLRQLPRDSIEAEMARDQRLMDRWGWSRPSLGR
jgi:TonB family protein